MIKMKQTLAYNHKVLDAVKQAGKTKTYSQAKEMIKKAQEELAKAKEKQ